MFGMGINISLTSGSCDRTSYDPDGIAFTSSVSIVAIPPLLSHSTGFHLLSSLSSVALQTLKHAS